jgi:hypothetical protein
MLLYQMMLPPKLFRKRRSSWKWKSTRSSIDLAPCNFVFVYYWEIKIIVTCVDCPKEAILNFQKNIGIFPKLFSFLFFSVDSFPIFVMS